jgi:hypothetical protein
MLYRRTRGLAEEKDLLILVRTYSKTRIIRMAAYDRAKPIEPFPKASDTYTAKKAAPTIYKSTKILCPKSSESNLVA